MWGGADYRTCEHCGQTRGQHRVVQIVERDEWGGHRVTYERICPKSFYSPKPNED